MLLHTSASKLREAQTRSSFADDLIGLLGGLVDEGLVDVGNHTTTSNRSLDEGVQLLVTTDGELQMARSDTLHLYTRAKRRTGISQLTRPVNAGQTVHGS